MKTALAMLALCLSLCGCARIPRGKPVGVRVPEQKSASDESSQRPNPSAAGGRPRDAAPGEEQIPEREAPSSEPKSPLESQANSNELVPRPIAGPRAAGQLRDELISVLGHEQELGAPLEAHSIVTEIPAGQPLTMEGVMEQALANHPLIQVRRHEIDAARALLVTAGLLVNPEFVLNTGSEIDDSPSAGNSTDVTGRLTFTIQTGRKRARRAAVAQAGIRRATQTLSKESLLVMLEAADAAVEVMYLQELILLQEKINSQALELIATQRARVEANLVPPLDAAVAEVDAARIESARLEAIANLEAARARLSSAMGYSTPRPLSMSGKVTFEPVPQISYETLVAVAKATRPEVSEALATIAERQRAVGLAVADAKPDIELGPRFRESEGNANDELGMRFQADLPLFNRNQGGIAESVAKLRAARSGLAVAEIGIVADVAAAYAQLLPIQARLKTIEERVLPLADRAEQDLRNLAEGNLLDPFRGVQQLQSINRIRQNYLELRYLHHRLRVRLELSLGRPLTELMRQQAEPVVPPQPAAESTEPPLLPFPAAPPDNTPPSAADES